MTKWIIFFAVICIDVVQKEKISAFKNLKIDLLNQF